MSKKSDILNTAPKCPYNISSTSLNSHTLAKGYKGLDPMADRIE